MTSPVSQALAQRRGEGDGPVDPRNFVKSQSASLGAMLPTHLRDKSDAWARQVAGSLYKGSMTDGEYDLVIAARNNPDAFLIAMRQAAALGLTPGTDEYYLTPRKVGGRLEILGIVGYQGYIELMYRAGAVSSVIVELVYELDEFDYMPGRDEMPQHRIDWRLADRGKPWLVYAYARMQGGAVSKVVVMNDADIERIKKKSGSARSEKSPWATDPGAMWMKSAVRQLRKWVPTSSEYLSSQIRATHEGRMATIPVPAIPAGQAAILPGHQLVIDDPDEVVDGELEPDVPAAEPVSVAPPPDSVIPIDPGDQPIKKAVQAALATQLGKFGAGTPEVRAQMVQEILQLERPLESLAQMTTGQAEQVLQTLGRWKQDADARAAAQGGPVTDGPPADESG